jgi:hypothetical protein
MINNLINEYGGIDRETLEKISKNEINFYEGSAYNDSCEIIEMFLSEYKLDVETDEIKISNRR